MRPPARDDRGPPHRYDTARVEVHCPATAAHECYLILEQATIYPDGWARWVEDGHEIFGYIQAGRCCDAPAVSALQAGAPKARRQAVVFPNNGKIINFPEFARFPRIQW